MADDALHVDLLGIQCNTGPDTDGIEWTYRTADDEPEIRLGLLLPTGRHGVSIGPSLRGGRRVSPAGMVKAPTQTLAWEARERLAVLGSDGEGDIVWHETVPKFLTVTQAGPALIRQPVDGNFDYELDLIAAFPFRRALTGTTLPIGAGTTALTNNGTVAAFPVITTTAAGAVDFTIDGRSFTTDAVPSGTVVDMWARTITDGSGATLEPWPKHSAAEWLAIPRGSDDLINAGVPLLVSWHDTYA